MLYAGTIDFCTVSGPVGQIRASAAGFSDVLYCSFKSSTSVISSCSIENRSTWSHTVSNSTIVGRTVRQPDWRVFVCIEFGRTVTLEAVGPTTSQRASRDVFRTNVETAVAPPHKHGRLRRVPCSLAILYAGDKNVNNVDGFVHFEHFSRYSNAKHPIDISSLRNKRVVAEAFSGGLRSWHNRLSPAS